MSKFHFIAILALLSLNSCRTHYALFQEESQYLIPAKIERGLVFENEPLEPQTVEIAVPTLDSEIENTISKVPKYFEKLTIENPELVIPDFVKVSELAAISLKPDPIDKEKRKKQRQRRNFWRQIGSNLVIGVIFLGVSILLSLVPLQTLSLLFGLASILLLFIGLKKIFKKRNRRLRNPFK